MTPRPPRRRPVVRPVPRTLSAALAVLVAGAVTGCDARGAVPGSVAPALGTTSAAVSQPAAARSAPAPASDASSNTPAAPSTAADPSAASGALPGPGAGSGSNTPLPGLMAGFTGAVSGPGGTSPLAALLGIPDLSALLVPSPDPEALTPLLDEALTLQDGTMSAAVMDAFTGELLYDRSGDVPAVPASAVKVLTAVAALQVLGPDHRYTTSAVALPAGADRTAVVLDAGGDVMLGTGSNGTDANGRAGLDSLAYLTAQALAERGTTGTVSIRLDDSGYAGPGTSDDWSPDIVGSGNASTVQPLATYGGRALPGRYTGRLSDPALYAADAFRRHLAAHARNLGVDVVVADGVERVRLDGRGMTLAGVESATVAEQMAHMLRTSDNQVAEATGRNVALAAGHPASFDGAARTIEQAVSALGVDTAGLDLVDASGLSARNRVSAAQLTSALRAATADPGLGAAVTGLPVAGGEGTLEHRMLGTVAEGEVRAKTGTLSSVASLTGTVETADGRELLFSFVANDQPGVLADARLAVDRAAVVLAGCGCGDGR